MKPLYVVFDEFKQAKTKTEKQNVLLKNYSFPLESVLRGTYNPNVKYTIEKVPYYKPDIDSPEGMGMSNIAFELKRAYLFEEGNPRIPPDLSEKRKNEILIQILESLEAKEAIVFMNMILKKDQAPGLDLSFMKETFPNLV